MPLACSPWRPNEGERVTATVLPGDREELAAAIPGRDGPWGVLLVVAAPGDGFEPLDHDLATVLADAIGAIVGVVRREEEVAHLLHRAEALRRVAGDIGSGVDLDRILAGLVDHAMVLFEGDRGAVFLRQPDGKVAAEVSRGRVGGVHRRRPRLPGAVSAELCDRRPPPAVLDQLP